MAARKDGDVLTKAEAKRLVLVQDNGMVHTFLNIPIGLVGADRTKESVFGDIDNSALCKRTGKDAQSIGHGLAVLPVLPCKQSDILFVETTRRGRPS